MTYYRDLQRNVEEAGGNSWLPIEADLLSVLAEAYYCEVEDAS